MAMKRSAVARVEEKRERRIGRAQGIFREVKTVCMPL